MKRQNTAVKFAIIILCISFLFLSLSFAAAEEKVIRILHVNDFHGFAEPYRPLGSDEPVGGIAYLASRAEELRKERPSLLLSAGDMIQGNNWANLFKGESVIELMNTMRFDAMVVGNHEFDFGQEILRKRISEAHFPVLGANIRGLDMLKPYVIREVGGVKVAIIGVVTEDAPVSTHPRNVTGLEFDPPTSSVRTYITQLENKADIFLVLSHIGLSEDRVLAEKVKGIDIIVGGHSHTKLPEPLVVGNTIIVQAWEHAKALGVLDLTVRDGKIVRFEGHLEEIGPKQGTEDKVVLAVVEKYRRRLDIALNKTVGVTEVDLDGENVRKRETNLGDLIADIVRQVSGADAAIINGGEIRTGIRKGKILVKDVYSVLPFNDYVVAVRLTGEQIREALEHGVSAIGEGNGRFPQVSGLSFVFDPTAGKGSRIKEILIAGKPLAPDKFYRVATNDFLAAGGDGYRVFGEAIGKSKELSMTEGIIKGGNVVYSDPGSLLKDIVIEYIRGKKAIGPKVEGRIREIR